MKTASRWKTAGS